MIFKLIGDGGGCCPSRKYKKVSDFCYGPCGAGDGLIGTCVGCGKEWEVDHDVIEHRDGRVVDYEGEPEYDHTWNGHLKDLE